MAGLTQEPLPSASEAPPESPSAGEPEVPQEIAGRSPLRIAFDRLRKDPVAIICFGIVVIFGLIAIFAGTLSDLFGVSTDTVRASDRIDLATGFGLKGPPYHGFDPEHPFGVAHGSGDDLLDNWLSGHCPSLLIATLAVVFSTVVGVVLGLIAGYMGGMVERRSEEHTS